MKKRKNRLANPTPKGEALRGKSARHSPLGKKEKTIFINNV